MFLFCSIFNPFGLLVQIAIFFYEKNTQLRQNLKQTELNIHVLSLFNKLC